MRDLLLTITFIGALIVSLVSARTSIVVLNWIWFQRPYEFSYGMWNTQPVYLMAFAIAALSNGIHGQLRPKFPPILIIYLILMLWVTLSAIFAFDPTQAWQFYWIFVPSMWLSPVLMFSTIHDIRLLRSVFWVAAGSLVLIGAKAGFVSALHGGAVISGHTSGFVGDNNVLALTLCLAIAILIGLRSTLPNRLWVRSGFFFIVAMALVCIVFTKSRGALLTLGVTFLVSSFLSGKPIRSLFTLLIVVVVGYFLIPSDYFDRLSTLENVQADRSAMGRVENWQLAWRTALAYPILGVGPENHIPYNRSLVPNVQVRVAHSVYFQVLGELGFPALFLYFSFVFLGVVTLLKTWRAMISVARDHPDLAWVRDLAFWTACGYVGYLFGSAMLNTFYVEFPWYAVFYGSMLRPLVERELSERQQSVVSKMCERTRLSLPTNIVR